MDTSCRNAVVVIFATILAASLFAKTAQEELEEALGDGFGGIDVISDTIAPPPYVPHRYRNAIPEFQWLLDKNGWTTNQLIEGLFCAITNNVSEENWSVRKKQRVARVAARKLSEIDSPAVTNFFRQFNEKDDTSKLKGITIPSMFRRTNLEPDVMAYMRTLCVRTNVYCKAEYEVIRDMLKTLEAMPDELKSDATNRVAKYMYFAIHNETDTQGWHDRELVRFIPSYSNSFQRLLLMRHVSNSASNTWERSNAAQVVQQLESLPTNQLNDISWIAEDVTGGK